ncbi:MAG: DUF6068 family protein [Myxococcaceae bacterium]
MLRRLGLFACVCCACPSTPAPAPRPAPVPAAVTPPPPPAPAAPPEEWPFARVGDRVEYTTGTRWAPMRAGGSDPDDDKVTSGRFALEVVKLEPDKVWVKVQLWRVGGSLSEWLLPLMAAPAPKPLGEPAGSDVVKAGDVSVHCAKWRVDMRSLDGPVTDSCITDEPPLYLTGAVYRGSTGSGFGGIFSSGGFRLTALTRGNTLEGGALPKLPVLMSPRSWFVTLGRDQSDDELDLMGEYVEERIVGREVKRSIWGTRQRADGEYKTGGRHFIVYPQPAVTLDLVSVLASLARLPVKNEGAPSSTTLRRGTFATVTDKDSAVFFADPLDPALGGLSAAARQEAVQNLRFNGAVLYDWGEGALVPTPRAQK